jgi:heterodisulfide reductase subunit B2
MKYFYYSGCSLEGTAREYDISTRAFLKAVGVDLIELEDWTCCGAAEAEPTSRLLSLVLPARNLALAENIGGAVDMIVPCSACYLNLKKVEEKIKKEAETLTLINEVLSEDHLHLQGKVRVRHLLDIIANDIGPEKIQSLIKKQMSDIVIAPYYGCQCLRPFPVFDDPEEPRSMEPIISATGANIHQWNMGGKCCGASHMNTEMDVGIDLVSSILKNAKGADAIVTVCPMCQMNLDGYQKKVSKNSQEDLSITVLYLPQLLGLAMGLSKMDIGLNFNLAVANEFDNKI